MGERNGNLPGTPSAAASEKTVANRSEIIRRWLIGHPGGISLDAGCGLGVYLPLLEMHSRRVFGADIVAGHLRSLSGAGGGARSPLLCMALEAAALRGSLFDLIICIETLEHVRDDERAVAELRRLLKPGGAIILSVPYKGFPFETHGIRIGSRIVSSPFGMGFPLLTYLPPAARKRFATVRVYTAGDLRKLFERHALRVREIRFLLPGMDVFERKTGSRMLAGLVRKILDGFGPRLSNIWGSTIVVVGEAC